MNARSFFTQAFFVLASVQAAASRADSFLKSDQLKSLLPCAVPLISKRIDESGFAKDVRVRYGDYEFTRTDVGDPDGELVVSRSGKVICTLQLSLNPEIYFSGQLQLLTLSAYSGSNQWFEFHRLKTSDCERIGSTNGAKDLAAVKKLLDNRGGSRTCGKVIR